MKFLVLIFIIFSTGCFSVTLQSNTSGSGKKQLTGSNFLWGAVPSVEQSHCENGIAQVTTVKGFSDILLSMITFGLYTPSTIYYSCRDPEPAPTCSEESAERPLKRQSTVYSETDLEAIRDAYADAIDKKAAIEKKFRIVQSKFIKAEERFLEVRKRYLAYERTPELEAEYQKKKIEYEAAES